MRRLESILFDSLCCYRLPSKSLQGVAGNVSVRCVTIARYEHRSPGNLLGVFRLDDIDDVETTKHRETLLPPDIRALLANARGHSIRELFYASGENLLNMMYVDMRASWTGHCCTSLPEGRSSGKQVLIGWDPSDSASGDIEHRHPTL